MPVAWFIIPYKRRPGNGPRVDRYPEIDDYSADIAVQGGTWRETEVLGDRCIVKVRARLGVLNALNDIPGFKRLPKDRLDDPLSDLSPAIRQALKAEVLDMGYTIAEVQARFGDDLGQYTLRQVLKFMAKRRRSPRYNQPTDEIVFDGPLRIPTDPDRIDLEVTE